MSRVIPLVILATVCSSVQAQFRQYPAGGQIVTQTATPINPDWATKLFDKKSIDFGVIATGSDSKKVIRLTNTLKQTVHIRGAGTTCGCSVATPSKNTLQPGEEATIEVTMNTRKFRRRKDSNVIVEIDAPQYAKVQIPITAYIRTDVVFDPGMVQFGAVAEGLGAKRQIRVAYAGRSDWTIKELRIGNKNILDATFNETRRANGRVDYTLDITLKPGTPTGRMRDLVTLVTDDQTNPYVPLLVEAEVQPEYVIKGAIALNGMNPGSARRVQIVVRNTARKPFEIDRLEPTVANNLNLQFQRPKAKKMLQIIPITVTAPEKAGRFNEEYNIWIKGRKEPLKIQVTGEVVAGLRASR